MVQPTIETTQQIDWEALIPEAEWQHYQSAIDELRAKGVRFALGGGLAFSEYASRVRNTKDLDLYIFPWDRDAAVKAVLAAGFEDYFDQCPYDRSWIFRAYKEPVIVDLIWTSPNHRFAVDPRWLTRGRDVIIRGVRMKVIPPEELIWAKMYVLQHDRCDWGDILNVLDNLGPLLDWRHLLDRVGPDKPLLTGVLSTFRWMSPDRARSLPPWLWEQVGLLPPEPDATGETSQERVALLDSRDWFGPKETFDPQK